MNLELSDICPECGCATMEEVDRDYEIKGSMDYDLEPEHIELSLTEQCTECGFRQTKYDNQPDPDEYYENKRERL